MVGLRDGREYSGKLIEPPEHNASASIIIRVSSANSPVRDTLDVLTSQRFTGGFEVVIVRHVMSDVRVEDLSREYPSLRLTEVTYESEFGYGRTLNLGIEAVSSEMVVLLSEHCRPIGRDWMAQLVGTLRLNDDCAAVWGPLIFGDEASDVRKDKTVQKIDLEWFMEHPNTGLQNSNAAVRRTLLRERRFSEKLAGCEDQEWAYHFLRKGWKTARVDGAPVLYEIRYGPLTYARKIYRENLLVGELVGNPPRITLRDLALGSGSILKGLLGRKKTVSASVRVLCGLFGGYLAYLASSSNR